MKTKHLFASAVMAAVLAGCSQEELTGLKNDNLGDRPMVEAPALTIGGVESRMTAEEVSAAGFANVEWEAGDGFGAAVMDIYDSSKEEWEDRFKIVDYINSNVLFKTEDGRNFYADASMPQGNHLFYAPFNVNNISREPLATQLPLEQVVVPTTNGMPSNSAIAAFYEDKTSPVFVAYDIVDDTPKTTLDLEMRHIYSLPLVTLELGNVRLLNEDGELKHDGTKDKNAVYEDNITINAIKFVQNRDNNDQKIVTKGYIKNVEVSELLKKTENGVVWDAKKYEDAETGNIVNVAKTTETVYPYETITVSFEGGLELTKANAGKFFMVLPGAKYTTDKLAVYVFATINGENYVSATTSLNGVAKTIAPARAARLLPGLPYAADEYNADGTKKETAGSSMTYTIAGGFIPAVDVETTGYVNIKTYADLENYIEDMAYRGEVLQQLTKADAISKIETKGIGIGAGQYDPKKHFVITASEEAPIMLDNDFIATFRNSCVITGKTAKINFLANQKNLVLGDIELTAADAALFTFSGTVWAGGNVILKAAPATNVKLLSTAEVTLHKDMTNTVVVENAENGIVNLNSAKGHTINNYYGELNVNAITAAQIVNGWTADNEDIENYIATMTIADEAEVFGAKNNLTGVVEINDAIVAMTENNGKIEMTDASAKLNVTVGNGEVNNTIGAKVSASTNAVYAYVSTFNLASRYDALTGLNKLVVNGVVTSDTYVLNTTINTIDFIEGSGIDFSEKPSADLNLLAPSVINIKADITWEGRDVTKSTLKVQAGAIKETWAKSETENYKLRLIDIDVHGYNSTWDGVYPAELPAKVNGVYEVNSANELAALLKNNWGSAAPGAPIELKIKLNADLNMGGYALNGMIAPTDNNNGKSFVEIDGNGKTISNLNLQGTEKVGLIAQSTVPVIVKNLTVENSTATATGGYVGVVFGWSAGAELTFENVTAQACNVKGTKSVAAIAGHAMGNGPTNPKVELNFKNCKVSDCMIEATEKRGATVLGCYTSENNLKKSGTILSGNMLVVAGTTVNVNYCLD